MRCMNARVLSIALVTLSSSGLVACGGDDPAVASSSSGGSAPGASGGSSGGNAGDGGGGGTSSSGGTSGSSGLPGDGGAGADGGASACTMPALPADAVNVTAHGAIADDSTDDTQAIIAAIAAVAKGGTVYVPGGTYLVTPTGCGGTGIQLKDDMTFLMAENAVLKSKPMNCGGYKIINISEVKNVVVAGGTIIGERNEHIGSSGEWGMGISLATAENVSIIGLTSKECWGDGIYVGPKGANDNVSKNITICGVTTDHNRRCGIAVTSASGVEIIDTTMSNSDGTLPKSGFCGEPDAAPDGPDGLVENVVIRDSRMLNNHVEGGYFGGPAPAVTRNNRVSGCTISGNHVRGFKASGNLYADDKSNGPSGTGFVFENSVVENNGSVDTSEAERGGLLLWQSAGATVTGNTLRNNTRGLAFESAHDATVTGNTFDNNSVAGVYFRWVSQNNKVKNNTCSGAAATIDGDGNTDRTGNTIENNTGCQLKLTSF